MKTHLFLRKHFVGLTTILRFLINQSQTTKIIWALKSNSEYLLGNQVQKQFFLHQFTLINHQIKVKSKILFYNQIDQDFLLEDFFSLILWLLYSFAPLKTWCLDLHQLKIMCNADFKFKNHSLTISENLCVKNLKIIENNFFINVLKKKSINI